MSVYQNFLPSNEKDTAGQDRFVGLTLLQDMYSCTPELLRDQKNDAYA
ncbi:MAG: hypothetical protein QG629_494, partial [Patescibacteria group bacterium]|nr:hypothetical protein [Patescibacteria group bacterium]